MERAAFTGTWRMVEWQEDGQTYSAFPISDRLVIDSAVGAFDRDQGTAFVGGFADTGRIAIAEVIDRRLRVTLTYTRRLGFGDGRTREPAPIHEVRRSLWVIGADGRLRVCDVAGDSWPDGVTTMKGDGREVRVYERERP